MLKCINLLGFEWLTWTCRLCHRIFLSDGRRQAHSVRVRHIDDLLLWLPLNSCARKGKGGGEGGVLLMIYYHDCQLILVHVRGRRRGGVKGSVEEFEGWGGKCCLRGNGATESATCCTGSRIFHRGTFGSGTAYRKKNLTEPNLKGVEWGSGSRGLRRIVAAFWANIPVSST